MTGHDPGSCGARESAALPVASLATIGAMPFDERALFTTRPETRVGRYQCPKCRRTGEYSIRWMRHSKKDRLPPGGDSADRAKFDKLRDYLLRIDDEQRIPPALWERLRAHLAA